MARIGVSITKSTAFRNSTQEFSNVYYYEMLALPSSSDASTLIDNLVTLEKTFHGTNVTFVRAKCWSQVGTASQNEMIHQKTLSGTGSRTPLTSMDKERAFLFRIRAGSDSRGKPVYLRKYFHACAEFVSAAPPSTTMLANTSAFSSGEKTAQVAAMQAIGDANGSAGSPKICSKVGRTPTVGASWTAHDFLEHHQFGDQWRA